MIESTISNMTNEVLEKLVVCTCGSGLKAMYLCDGETCKFKDSQPIYCDSCMSKTKHHHLPTKIADEVHEDLI